MARPVQAEGVGVDPERLGGLQRDPLYGNGQRENRQELSQPGISHARPRAQRAARVGRVSQLCASGAVAWKRVTAILASAVRTSRTVRSRSEIPPTTARTGRGAPRYPPTVLAARPGRPSASQSATAA